ncbi:hypothetical protein ACH42_01320 [Endozoicomonas sp. (ex Bugula neritina AB1)]|nr:hypothetical protein ACH42_01320 [Endozoicomonas sp. (ex Bugula neritina AB1)]
MPIPQYPVMLKRKFQLSDNTIQLDFEFEEGPPKGFSFIAGQFIQFLIPTKEKLQKRSYSIACSPESFKKNGLLEVAISLVEEGLASELFTKAEAGLSLNISGPFGVLTLPDSLNGQLILIGTGTGIAPYRSMIPSLQQLVTQEVSITLIMGARHRNDLIYLDDFTTLKNIDCRICLSRETDLKQQNHEFSGYVQQQFTQLSLNPEADLVYLCGNPSMIDDAAAELKEIGFPPRQVKREKYVFSGH